MQKPFALGTSKNRPEGVLRNDEIPLRLNRPLEVVGRYVGSVVRQLRKSQRPEGVEQIAAFIKQGLDESIGVQLVSHADQDKARRGCARRERCPGFTNSGRSGLHRFGRARPAPAPSEFTNSRARRLRRWPIRAPTRDLARSVLLPHPPRLHSQRMATCPLVRTSTQKRNGPTSNVQRPTPGPPNC
jgi:hypothetical protein